MRKIAGMGMDSYSSEDSSESEEEDSDSKESEDEDSEEAYQGASEESEGNVLDDSGNEEDQVIMERNRWDSESDSD
jgi:hypothetical protein